MFNYYITYKYKMYIKASEFEEKSKKIMINIDNNDDKIKKISLYKLVENINKYNAKKYKIFIYKKFKCEILFFTGWYCGYIREFNDTVNKYLEGDTLNNNTLVHKKMKNVYNPKPHNCFTAGYGFDTASSKTILITRNKKNNYNIDFLSDANSFKTYKYVKIELQKVVDSMILISSK